jgi:membrane protein implicated in regulation of membrane protease activity
VETLLGWQSLVFYVPVAFGALLALGAAFGLAGDGAHGEGAADGGDGDDGGDGGEAGTDGDDGLSLLALGKLPLTIRLMLLAFTFGGLGLVVGPVVRAILPGSPTVAGVLAIVFAAPASLLLSGIVARFAARRMPMLETETVRRADLVGAVGRLVLPASEQGGVLQVHDRRGNLHQVPCRLAADEPGLPSGAAVLLVDYDEAARTFVVAASPLTIDVRRDA